MCEPLVLSDTLPFALSLSKPVLSQAEGGIGLEGRHEGLRQAQPERSL